MNIKCKNTVGLCCLFFSGFFTCDGLAYDLQIRKSGGLNSCGSMQSSGGSVVASLTILSRSIGISPETVYFSAQQSNDPNCIDFSGGDDLEACRTGQYFGYHFNFDDPDSGVFDVTGNSKNQQVSGAPRAAHTFVCDGSDNSRWNDSTQQCEFAVKVRVQNPAGDWDDACTNVSIRPQSVEYSAAETFCVSSDSDFTACPAGVPAANRLTDSPAQNLSNLSHSRVLFQRGSTGMYSPMCIGYDESNVRIDAYGVGADPLIEEVVIGTAQGCNDMIPTTPQASSYDVLNKDINGHISQGWAFGNGVTNLRLRNLTVGMTATLLTLHDLDLDWSNGGAFSSQGNGYLSLNSSGWYCYSNNDLDCDLVPYPYGIFLSEVRSVGDVANMGEAGHIPDLNIGCFNDCGIVNSAIIGTYGKAAFEHNLRVMGAWGLVISNSHFAGDHAGSNGPKSKITLRQIRTDAVASEVVNPEDFISGNHPGDGPGWQRNSDVGQHFYAHYNFLIDNILGDTVNTVTEDAGWFEFRAGHQYSSAFATEFLLWPDADFNATQLALGGRNITTHGTTFNGSNVNCRFNTRGWPQPSYQFDASLIFSDAPNGQCNGAVRPLPVPETPGVYDDLIFIDGFDGLLLGPEPQVLFEGAKISFIANSYMGAYGGLNNYLELVLNETSNPVQLNTVPARIGNGGWYWGLGLGSMMTALDRIENEGDYSTCIFIDGTLDTMREFANRLFVACDHVVLFIAAGGHNPVTLGDNHYNNTASTLNNARQMQIEYPNLIVIPMVYVFYDLTVNPVVSVPRLDYLYGDENIHQNGLGTLVNTYGMYASLSSKSPVGLGFEFDQPTAVNHQFIDGDFILLGHSFPSDTPDDRLLFDEATQHLVQQKIIDLLIEWEQGTTIFDWL